MKLQPKNVKKFQAGGQMATPAEAPVDDRAAEMTAEETPAQGGEDPLMQLAQMAMQALQNQDCSAAFSVCEAFVQLLQQAQADAQQEEPVFYRNGGTIVRKKY